MEMPAFNLNTLEVRQADILEKENQPFLNREFQINQVCIVNIPVSSAERSTN